MCQCCSGPDVYRLGAGSGLLVPLSHCSILSTLLSSGLATAAADNNNTTTLHNIPEYKLRKTSTMFHATTLLSKLCISVITPICTAYRVLYNIYCEVYQESNQKLFKLIALRILNYIFYLLCAACNRQRSESTFNFPSLSCPTFAYKLSSYKFSSSEFLWIYKHQWIYYKM